MTVVMNGFTIENFQGYAADKRYIVIKKIDGAYWFDGADDSLTWAAEAYHDCRRYADDVVIIDTRDEEVVSID